MRQTAETVMTSTAMMRDIKSAAVPLGSNLAAVCYRTVDFTSCNQLDASGLTLATPTPGAEVTFSDGTLDYLVLAQLDAKRAAFCYSKTDAANSITNRLLCTV